MKIVALTNEEVIFVLIMVGSDFCSFQAGVATTGKYD